MTISTDLPLSISGQSNLARGRIAVSSPLAIANAFVHRVRRAGTFAPGNRNALVLRYATMHRYKFPSQKCYVPWGIWTPIKYMIPWTDKSQPQDSIWIGSAVYEQSTYVPKTRTDIQTDHAMCDICSNRPHQRTVCMRCDLKISQHFAKLPATVQWRPFLDSQWSISPFFGATRY